MAALEQEGRGPLFVTDPRAGAMGGGFENGRSDVRISPPHAQFSQKALRGQFR